MNAKQSQTRGIERLIAGNDTQDGAGVRLTRMLPAVGLKQLDPFLLLDSFRSDNPNDYIAGFPPHPHRGFETVTYLLAGRVRHRDSAGHVGVIKAGGVQWMTAGRGIEHSEMPEQENGLLEGFQLWVNLPAASKMTEPRYQELEPNQIPEEIRKDGTRIRVIAGRTEQGTQGPISEITADPLFLDVSLSTATEYREAIPSGYNAFIYQISGSVFVLGENQEQREIAARHLAVLDVDGAIHVRSEEPCRFLLVAGRPIGEPVSRHGPFVMNTPEEIDQAYKDYEAGLFGRVEVSTDEVA